MIISHRYKFIFIKTVKTAGTSLEVFLSQHCSANDIVTPIRPAVEPHHPRNHLGLWNPLPELIDNKGKNTSSIIKDLIRRRKFYNHISAQKLKNRVPNNTWNNYFRFCVERNPWDKTLSHYHMLNARSANTITFDEYLQKGNFALNVKRYTNKHNHLLVDKVIKYEQLDTELLKTFTALGIPFNGKLSPTAKASYRKDRRPYQEVYNTRQRKIIEEAFASEIALHGYTF